MKSTFIFVLFCLTLSCSRTGNSLFVDISKEISTNQVSNQIIDKVDNHFYCIRQKLEKHVKLDSMKFDTLYLLESYQYEDGRTNGMLKAGNSIVVFTYFKGYFSFTDKPSFPKLMIDDALNWNFSLGRIGVQELYPSQNVYVSRVIRDRDSLRVDTRVFNLYDTIPVKR